MRVKSLLNVHLYDEGTSTRRQQTEDSRQNSGNLDVQQIVVYLEEKLGAVIIDSRESLTSLGNLGSLAAQFAEARVKDPGSKDNLPPFHGEIEYEKKRLNGTRKRLIGILYDGFMLQEIYSRLIPEEEKNLKHCHIILTPDLIATWDEKDGRYHARVSVYGFPSIVSTTGAVEAPAKPKEFYLKKNLGIDPLILKEEFKGKFIDYDDSRLSEVMKGYCMQAIFYHLTGDPFCSDNGCRLYNAHWQEELIKAQLNGDYEFCRHHQEILENLKKIYEQKSPGPVIRRA